MTNPTDRTGDVATVAATVIFCRAIAVFYVSRCEMSIAWADLCIANLEFLISCRAVRFSCMGRELFCRAVRFSCMGRGMSCHANREQMMVGARTRCSWMAGEWPNDAKGVMAGSEGDWAFGEGVMTGDEGLATCGECGNGGCQGDGLGRCGHEERDKSNCWCLLLSLCGDCACRL